MRHWGSLETVLFLILGTGVALDLSWERVRIEVRAVRFDVPSLRGVILTVAVFQAKGRGPRQAIFACWGGKRRTRFCSSTRAELK